MANDGNHIGTLVKSHGYKGELVLTGNPAIIDKLTTGIPLFIDIDGQRVPFFIESVDPDASGERCIIKLEFIDSLEEAAKVITCNVYANLKTEHQDQDLDVEKFIGFQVTDRVTKLQGKVTDSIVQPENPILILDFAGNEVMLPARADYIEEINTEEGYIIASFPEGLIES